MKVIWSEQFNNNTHTQRAGVFVDSLKTKNY